MNFITEPITQPSDALQTTIIFLLHRNALHHHDNTCHYKRTIFWQLQCSQGDHNLSYICALSAF